MRTSKVHLLGKTDTASTVDVIAMDYWREYIASPLWRKIKRHVLKRDEKTCFHCGGAAVLVHHRSYERPVLSG